MGLPHSSNIDIATGIIRDSAKQKGETAAGK